MDKIPNVRTQAYERCLKEAVEYSNNSQQVTRSAIWAFSDCLSKMVTYDQQNLTIRAGKMLFLQSFDSYWKAVSHSVLTDWQNPHLTMTKKDSIKLEETLLERTNLIKRMKPVQTWLNTIQKNKQDIISQLKTCEEPANYYSIQQQKHYYAELDSSFKEYSNKQPVYEGYLKETNKFLKQLSSINRKLSLEGETVLKESDRAMLTVNHHLQELLSQFIVTVISQLDQLKKRLQHLNLQTLLTIDNEEFKRGYLSQLSQNAAISREQIKYLHSRSILQIRSMAEGCIFKHRFAHQVMRTYFNRIVQTLQNAKKTLIPMIEDVAASRLTKEGTKLCPGSRLLHRTLKSLRKMLQIFMDVSSDMAFSCAQGLRGFRDHTTAKMQIYRQRLERLFQHNSQSSIRDLLSFHDCAHRQLEGLRVVELEDNHQTKQVLQSNVQRLIDAFNHTFGSLGLANSGDNLPAVNIYEYIRNQILHDIMYQPVMWDHSFDVRIQHALAHPFQFPDDESISAYGDGSYSCALGGKFLITGRMKILPSMFCFESVFNKRNLFFGKTKIIIPKTHIVSIQKQSIMLIHNSILINTKMGPLLITSLFSRDQVFQEFQKMLNSTEDKDYVTEINDEADSVKSDEPTKQELEELDQQQKTYDSKLTTKLLNENIEFELDNMTVKQYFRYVLSAGEARRSGKCYQNFKVMLLKTQECSEIKCPNWQPTPPSYFDKESAVKLIKAQPSKRSVSYKRKLPSLPIPFMPTHSDCIQNQTLHWISHKLIVLQKENYASGVMFADSFHVKQRMIIQQVADNKIKVNWTYDIVFKEGASMQSVLRGAAEKEIKAAGTKTKTTINDYVSQVRQRVKKRGSKKKGEEKHEETESTEDPEPDKPQPKNLKMSTATIAIILVGLLFVMALLAR